MLKRLVFVLTVCACVGVAYGAAVKIRAFETFAPESPDADGMAILNYASGHDETIVQVIISDFTPNTRYQVVVVSPTHSDFVIGDIVTGPNGHGTIHMSPGNNPLLNEGGDYSDADIHIYVNFGSIDPERPEELRAVGLNPGSS